LISRRDVNATIRKYAVVPFGMLYASFVAAECRANRANEMLLEMTR
jgi:hypothetical protein